MTVNYGVKERLGILQERLAEYRVPQEFMERGIYPYFREATSKQETEVVMEGHRVLMFGSNAYTGLTNHPEVICAGQEALERYGSGCAGSRFLNGTIDLHNILERRIAQFIGKEEALVLTTGFTVNSGIIPQLVGRNDYILYDSRVHASIIDGRRLASGKAIRFRHNDMADLEAKLAQCRPDAVKLIVVDGVYSMEGDLAPLPEIVALKQQYNATLMVDEAHGVGVFGDSGRGICDHFGVTDEVDLVMGTFSKSLASIGGFVAADSVVINYLRHTCRTYIFSASPSPASAACALKALELLEREPERMEHLWTVTNYALRRLREEGFEIGDTASPIIPLYVRDVDKTFEVTQLAFDRGLFINPVIPPACAAEDTLVRFALMATHTTEQVERAVQILKSCFTELGIL